MMMMIFVFQYLHRMKNVQLLVKLTFVRRMMISLEHSEQKWRPRYPLYHQLSASQGPGTSALALS